MAFFKTNDHERELLEAFFVQKGLFGEALDRAICSAKEEIAQGKPIAYIIGEEAFYDLVFKVNEDVLIPRPDTEHLVEKAIGLLPKGGHFADLGTGSGCIAVTVLKHRPDVTGVALDLSAKALAVALFNAKEKGVDGRVTFVEGDMRKEPLQDALFDLVISNPPYIPRADIKKYPSLAYEPQSALDGGEDGMDFYTAILKDYRKNLKKNGGFLFEIGFDQGDAIRDLGKSLGYSCSVYKDYGKNHRVALLFPLEQNDNRT